MLIKKRFIKLCSIFIAAALITGCGNTGNNSNTSSTSNSGNGGLPDKMPSFTTKDLEGNTITDSIFKGKDLTVVNIWGLSVALVLGKCQSLGSGQKKCQRMYSL